VITALAVAATLLPAVVMGSMLRLHEHTVRRRLDEAIAETQARCGR
jgi:hypothetical protein